MHRLFSWLAISLAAGCLLGGCRGADGVGGDGNNVLVRVGEHRLTQEELDDAMPVGLSPADSASFAAEFIRAWVEDILLYDVAAENIPGMARIDRMTEQFRRELVIFEYQKQLMNEKLSRTIPESEIQAYYDSDPERFRLKSGIVKGLFLKVPRNAPRISSLKKWYKSDKPEAVENIEKYGLRNAVIYEYFYDRWVPFREVMNNIPCEIGDETAFLQTHRTIEWEDSLYVYLLNIKDVLVEGRAMPIDFARKQIEEILLTRRKNEFIRDMQKDLYESALKRKEIEFREAGNKM